MLNRWQGKYGTLRGGKNEGTNGGEKKYGGLFLEVGMHMTLTRNIQAIGDDANRWPNTGLDTPPKC